MKKAPFSVALLYFLKVISQPFKITNRICRFCNILDRMTDNFFKGVFIHIRFFCHSNKSFTWIVWTMFWRGSYGGVR